MRYPSLNALLARSPNLLTKGPVALIFAEDETEVMSTLEHHLNLGFAHVIGFLPDRIALPAPLEDAIHRVALARFTPPDVRAAINSLIAAASPGCWLYYCFNGEYLFYPFCETRSVRELLTFHRSERRFAMLTSVVDLYAPDLTRSPDGVDRTEACFDAKGYFAKDRWNAAAAQPHERQLDLYGGLHWRFEEHIPYKSRRIDRYAVFRAKPGLQLQADHLFNDPEYNTYACPWHNNLTATICSFRTAKALRRNPGSRPQVHDLNGPHSTRFVWHSQQLMDLGLMEPGQWF